ncbi:MAG: putative sulfate exporter family transporter, partial [Bryobacteraceae bacterium]
MLFQEVLAAGALGMLQAVLVVIVIWYFSFWFAKRMRLDDDFAAILSSAVSICGVSAAIATCGAIQGDRRKLSYVASVVLIVAIPMMLLQPWIIRASGIPDEVGGAWLGGTLDTTGSVVAAGVLVSETAMKIGTIVKFSQNVLIGFAAFLLSFWWTVRKPSAGQVRPT